MGAVITIPKELTKKGELVLIPRADYEELLRIKKIIPLVKPSPSEKRAIKEARRELREGKYLTLKQFQHELAD